MDTHVVTNAIAPSCDLTGLAHTSDLLDACDLTGPAHTSDLFDASDQLPRDASATNTTQPPDMTLVLDLVAGHLPFTEDGVRAANKLSRTCTALRGVGAPTRAGFVEAHNALLDHLLSKIDLEDLAIWLRKKNKVGDDEVPDYDWYQHVNLTPDLPQICVNFTDAFIVALRTPHFHGPLYTRSIQIFHDFYYQIEDTMDSCNVEIETLLRNGGMLAIYDMMRALISGSFADDTLLQSLATLFHKLFRSLRSQSLLCFRLLYEASRDRSVWLVLRDFYSLYFLRCPDSKSCNNSELDEILRGIISWAVQNIHLYGSYRPDWPHSYTEYKFGTLKEYTEYMRENLSFVRHVVSSFLDLTGDLSLYYRFPSYIDSRRKSLKKKIQLIDDFLLEISSK